MKKEVSLTGLIQLIAFIGLFVVSTGLGIILYTGLSHDTLSYTIMLIVAAVIECVKIYSLTMSNTHQWQSQQLKNWYIEDYIKGSFDLKNKSKIKNGKVLKAVEAFYRHKKKGWGFFAVYLLCAFLSISASYGYISQTVYLSTQSSTTVSTTDLQGVYVKQIEALQNFINQDTKLNIQYSLSQDKLDMNDPKYQANYNSYQVKIDKNNTDIQKKLAEIEAKNNLLLGLEEADAKVQKTEGKTMYQLMGDSLSIPEDTVMFILLYMLAVMIEVGLFITSPHINNMDQEDLDTKPETKLETKPETKPETKMETVVTPPTRIETPREDKPEEMEPQEEEIKTVVEEKEDVLETPELPLTPIPVSSTINVKVNEVEAETKIEEPHVVKKIVDKTKLIDNFIEAMFDTDGRVRDTQAVAQEVGLPLIHALKIVDYLTKEKGYVTFRPPLGWYRVGEISTIKSAIGKLYGVAKKENS